MRLWRACWSAAVGGWLVGMVAMRVFRWSRISAGDKPELALGVLQYSSIAL